MKAGFLAVILGMMALPAVAQDCLSGKPTRVTYSDGRVITIIQRHGDDMTYTQPAEGFQDTVSKTHLMLFPKTWRGGARSIEYRWTTRLPKLSQMVVGYHFDMKGTMKSGDGNALPYRSEGDVVAQDVIKIGSCAYQAVVITSTTYLNGQPIMTSTDYLSPDLSLVLQSKSVPTSSGSQSVRTAVAVE